MNNSSEDDISHVDLLHPEILSCKQLCSLFEKRRIPVEQYKDLSKQELLNLYHSTILPLPQRNYKETRRGKLLKSRQEKLSTETKNEASNSTPKTKVKLSRNFNPAYLDSSPTSSSVPKSSHTLITFEKTTPTSKHHSSPVNGIGRSLAKKTEAADSPNSDSKRNKIIRLINNTLTSNKNGSTLPSSIKRKPSETEAAAVSPSPKKKHKPITWP